MALAYHPPLSDTPQPSGLALAPRFAPSLLPPGDQALRHLRLVPVTPSPVTPAAVVNRPVAAPPRYLARRLVVGLLAVIFIYGLWSLAAGAVSIASATTAESGEAPIALVPAPTRVVQPGETLWSIAVSLDTGSDIRQVVDQIAALNGDQVVLQPGQRLVLPRYDS